MGKNSIENGQSNLVNAIYNGIKNDINERYMQPGDKIKIKQLCERYNISETPIKQALILLTSEGLIEHVPKKGMCIRVIGWKELEEIFNIRLMIELHFKKDIITTVQYDHNIRKALEDNLKYTYELLDNATELEHNKKIYLADSDFHMLYLKCAGNQKAVEIYRSLNVHVYSNYIYGKQTHKKTIAGIDEHQQILNAIVSQDENALEKAIRLHIENARSTVYMILKMDSISANFF
jgi:DNA-binding GntR family transcriptional regulator